MAAKGVAKKIKMKKINQLKYKHLGFAMAAAMAAKAVAKKRAGGHIKPVPFVAPELPWRSKPEVEEKNP